MIGREKIPETPCTEHDFWHVGADVVDRSLSDLDDRLAFIADGISRMLYRGVLYLWAGSLISDAIGEVFSGVTMGLGIFAITIYLNTVTQKSFLFRH